MKKPSLRLAKGRRATPVTPIDEAIEAFRAGQMLIVVDDEHRENEGDLTMAASKVTPDAINFMAKHGRGLVCLAMTPERLEALDVPLEVSDNSSRRETAFCVSIDARAGTTTGISAADRARTVEVAIAEDTAPKDLSRPGHRSSRAPPHRPAPHRARAPDRFPWPCAGRMATAPDSAP